MTKIEAFIDTSFLIATVNPKDLYHQQAMRLASLYKGSYLITTEAVCLEVGNSLAARYRQEVAHLIREMLSSPEIEVVPTRATLLETGLDFFTKYKDKQWGLVNCVSFIVMRGRGIINALTHDHHFQQAGFNPLMRPQ